ncbi:MAG TPA: hypothetical protein VFE11_07865 [Dongiaceae bacterium]|nr:hypothetical protein [Dongiaceae bacterium]
MVPVSLSRPLYLVGALLLSAAGAVAALPAMAQTDTSSNVWLTPEQTMVCVCLGDAIARARGGLDAPDPLEAEYNRLDALVNQARPNVDPYDQAEVDSFRRLYERHEELRRQLQTQGGGVNGLAMQYNAQCANKKMLKLNVDAARANPQCPQP